MRYTEINEANLKLLPGEIPRMRGSYGAFLITMDPADFLRLTASPQDRTRIEDKLASQRFPMNRDDFYGTEDEFGRFPMPFLTVYWPSGKITGHEGRHRALMVLQQGGKNFPVVIFLRHETEYEVTYRRFDPDTDETTEHTEPFGTDHAAAEQRKRELENHNDGLRTRWDAGDFDGDQTLYQRVKINYLRGDTIKGSPTQADPEDYWKRKPYTAEDMPKQLIAQYDDGIAVTKFRVGRVKGYRHFS